MHLRVVSTQTLLKTRVWHKGTSDPYVRSASSLHLSYEYFMIHSLHTTIICSIFMTIPEVTVRASRELQDTQKPAAPVQDTPLCACNYGWTKGWQAPDLTQLWLNLKSPCRHQVLSVLSENGGKERNCSISGKAKVYSAFIAETKWVWNMQGSSGVGALESSWLCCPSLNDSDCSAHSLFIPLVFFTGWHLVPVNNDSQWVPPTTRSHMTLQLCTQDPPPPINLSWRLLWV